VLGAEYQLQQVLLNLVLNARDAMATGGWLTVATRREEGRVVVDISDTGAGIRPEHLARIYDPFFTTKSGAQGTGLGLSIAYGIVQDHAGTLSCASTEGTGTRFTIALPEIHAGRGQTTARVAR
jgi:signal transduction histidine kinase